MFFVFEIMDDICVTMFVISWQGAVISGMVLLQVAILTGYTPTNLDTINTQTNGQVPRVDNDGLTIVLYINQVTSHSVS